MEMSFPWTLANRARRAIAAQPGARLEVLHEAVDPPAFEAWLASVAPGSARTAQSTGSLGDRLAAGLQGAGVRLALGMDAPDLPVERLQQAANALAQEGVDVVLGPAPDGGYYLLGLADGVDPSFLAGAIRWSTPHTQVETRRAAEAVGLRVALLEPHADVDDVTDLRALAARLAQDPSPAPATAGWLAARFDTVRNTSPQTPSNEGLAGHS